MINHTTAARAVYFYLQRGFEFYMPYETRFRHWRLFFYPLPVYLVSAASRNRKVAHLRAYHVVEKMRPLRELDVHVGEKRFHDDLGPEICHQLTGIPNGGSVVPSRPKTTNR